ncbi:hypothetical protein Daes_2760 [Pseudodesulfovibrio aespoeensis Aspo-2]|uniref:Uncharacterized protein n=1 Tax=Pseudodesulfovibrio aespoeensis (strain ATCC 700646 / DSM 10631 / Aspo-2) TaxID=643562 RepID=E6VXE0_PSEA9|nr:hypothetical protein Daes_2760 [Pseudodesulfovibrio aespoeensis Aspo-2]
MVDVENNAARSHQIFVDLLPPVRTLSPVLEMLPNQHSHYRPHKYGN